jgi:hypothetical protein
MAYDYHFLRRTATASRVAGWTCFAFAITVTLLLVIGASHDTASQHPVAVLAMVALYGVPAALLLLLAEPIERANAWAFYAAMTVAIWGMAMPFVSIINRLGPIGVGCNVLIALPFMYVFACGISDHADLRYAQRKRRQERKRQSAGPGNPPVTQDKSRPSS